MPEIRNPTLDLIEKQEEANKLLSQIAENTSVLKELVEINRKTQLDTEELKNVLGAVHEVARAREKKKQTVCFKKR